MWFGFFGLRQGSHFKEIQQSAIAIIAISVGMAGEAIRGCYGWRIVGIAPAAYITAIIEMFTVHLCYTVATCAIAGEYSIIIDVNVTLGTIVPFIPMLTAVYGKEFSVMIKGWWLPGCRWMTGLAL
jgi:hypothetical protein